MLAAAKGPDRFDADLGHEVVEVIQQFGVDEGFDVEGRECDGGFGGIACEVERGVRLAAGDEKGAAGEGVGDEVASGVAEVAVAVVDARFFRVGENEVAIGFPVDDGKPLGFAEEGGGDFGATKAGTGGGPHEVEEVAGMALFHRLVGGGGHAGEKFGAGLVALDREGDGGEAAHAVVVEGFGIGVVDAVGERAAADEAGEVGVVLLNGGEDVGVADAGFLSEQDGEVAGEAGLVHLRVAREASVGLAVVEVERGESMAPESAGVAAFGECDGVGFESGEDEFVFGEKIILAEENAGVSPVPCGAGVFIDGELDVGLGPFFLAHPLFDEVDVLRFAGGEQA